MNPQDTAGLTASALRVRERIIGLATGGGSFIGASLSCADLFVFLYRRFLNLHKNNLDDPSRDYLLLSKGHAVPALYATFVEMGWLSPQRLARHLSIDDHLYWHPNRHIPGVEFHSGSLGHGLPIALGVALDCKLRGRPSKVVVVTGDGELNEGSNWEALLIARAYKLDNLIIVVDRNAFQANLRTEDLIPLEPLEAKFAAFGCPARRVDGHDFAALDVAFNGLPLESGHPSAIIAETIRGCGLPSIQERADRWFYNFSPAEIEALLAELHENVPRGGSA